MELYLLNKMLNFTCYYVIVLQIALIQAIILTSKDNKLENDIVSCNIFVLQFTFMRI